MHFIRQIEYRRKLKHKNNQEKIKDFFECFNFLNTVKDEKLDSNSFYSDSAQNSSDSSDEDDN